MAQKWFSGAGVPAGSPSVQYKLDDPPTSSNVWIGLVLTADIEGNLGTVYNGTTFFDNFSNAIDFYFCS